MALTIIIGHVLRKGFTWKMFVSQRSRVARSIRVSFPLLTREAKEIGDVSTQASDSLVVLRDLHLTSSNSGHEGERHISNLDKLQNTQEQIN